jgi:soluble lytic murein transglycosylase-like protein
MPLLLSPHLYDAVWVQSVHFDVDYYLITAIIATESAFDPLAIGDSGQSYGLMQLHLRGAGHGQLPTDLLDLDRNLELGVAYLRECLDAYPEDRFRAIAAFNRGIAGARSLDEPERDSYVRKVLEHQQWHRTSGIERRVHTEIHITLA